MIKYTIIVPFYNVKDYIKECAKSIYNQTYKDFEVYFVDDGSPDETRDVLEKYLKIISDKRFKILTKKNGGQGSARNYGLKKAKGKYILFLDSDDFIHKTCLEEVDKVLSTKDLDILIFNFFTYFDKNYYYETKGLLNYSDQLIKNAIISPPAPWNKIYNRDFLLKTKVEFPEKIWYEDLATFPRIVPKTTKIGYLNKPLHYYRQRQGSVMNSINNKMFDMYKVLDIIYNYYVDNEILKEYYYEIERIFIYNCFFLINKLSLTNNKDKLQLQKEVLEYLNNHFEHWYKNPYLEKERMKTKIHIKIMKYKNILFLYNKIRRLKK